MSSKEPGQMQEEREGGGLFGMVKHAVGLGGPKERPLQQHELHESETPPASPEQTPAAKGKLTSSPLGAKQAPATSEQGEQEQVVATAVAVAVNKATADTEDTPQTKEGNGKETTENIPEAQQGQPGQATSRRVHVDKLLKPQEVEAGFERPQFSTATEMNSGELYGRGPATPQRLEEQGVRVHAERVGGAMPIAAKPVQAQREEHRPEGVPTLAAADLAQIEAKEHAKAAEEARKRAQAKHEELVALRQQAKALEEQSEALAEEAHREKRRVEEAMRKKGKIDHLEWRGYALAERAEAERRSAVERARPAMHMAEELDRETLVLKQESSDKEYHAQVLENRARALLKESEEMANLSLQKEEGSWKKQEDLDYERKSLDRLKQQINSQPARGLPAYIQECEREIGALQYRINQLREEIGWAELEISKGREEADSWRRVVVARESKIALLFLELKQLQEDAQIARARSRKAAEESFEPTELAEKKYVEAWTAARRATEMEEEAKAAQQEAMTAARQALEPQRERQRALRDAAEAEAAARVVETRVSQVEFGVHRREHEAEVKRATAEKKEEEAAALEVEETHVKQQAEEERDFADQIEREQKEHRRIEVPAV